MLKLFNKIIGVFIVLGFLIFPGSEKALAQNELNIPKETFMKAEVLAVKNSGITYNESTEMPFQVLVLKVLDGGMKGQEITVDYGKTTLLNKNQLLKTGETVVLLKTEIEGSETLYQITDRYRFDSVIPIVLFFFALVILLSGWKGAGSVIGMIISLGVILKYIVPQILAGANPLTVSIIGSLVIMFTTIYLAHGFSVKTTIAVFSTFLTLVLVGILSGFFVDMFFLTGLGDEIAVSLRFGSTTGIDLKGLLLGGILIGVLGVLDDITTGISATVFELHSANPHMKFGHLFKSALNVGKEHISSLVNTLVLAYAGSGLPIFLMINMNENRYPMWFILNDELIIEELVRTLTGSIGLIVAVPLTTAIACWWVKRKALS